VTDNTVDLSNSFDMNEMSFYMENIGGDKFIDGLVYNVKFSINSKPACLLEASLGEGECSDASATLPDSRLILVSGF